MTAPIVQAEYDQLEAIAARFGDQSQRSNELHARLAQGVQALAQGGWQGRGVEAFLTEMDGEVFPALQRLIDALAEAGMATNNITALIRTAEEEAAAPFMAGGAAAGGAAAAGAGGAGVGTGGAGGQGDGQGGGTGNGTGSAGAGGDAGGTDASPSGAVTLPTPLSPDAVFTDQYMLDFIGTQVQGADSAELNQLAETLLTNPSGQQLDDTLNRLADIRGVPREEFRAQYDRYLELGGPGSIDLSKRGDFLGSTASLRSGQVVGDVLGIDPLFGALLNPTGGLVGPGETGYHPGDNDPVGYHGIFHDAAGYLYNHQNIGPGYDYLGQELGRDTADPLTGQRAGIQWWLDQRQLDPPGPDFLLENPVVPNVLGAAYEVVILDGGQVVTGVGGAIGDIWNGDFGGAIDNLGQAGQGAARIPIDIAVGIGRTAVDTSVEVGGLILDGAGAVAGGIEDGLSTVGGWLGF